MFFDDLAEIENIGQMSGCAIFLVPNSVEVKVKNALTVQPEERASISIDQMREVVSSLATKQLETRFVVVRPADLLSDAAENMILKNLEEPSENVHYLLVTEQPHKLLPTIRSRASFYVWRGSVPAFDKVNASEKTKQLAKELMGAKPYELVEKAENLAKKKDGARANALEILAAAIEMSYKTYFLTGKKTFLKKAEKLITAYDSIAAGGHIKLHLVADLL